MHKEALKEFDRILGYRAILSFTCLLLYSLIFIGFEESGFTKSMDKEESNEDPLVSMMPVMKYLYIGLTFGRIPLILLALQKSSVCKTFIFY